MKKYILIVGLLIVVISGCYVTGIFGDYSGEKEAKEAANRMLNLQIKQDSINAERNMRELKQFNKHKLDMAKAKAGTYKE